jgi:hypothetical protein
VQSIINNRVDLVCTPFSNLLKINGGGGPFPKGRIIFISMLTCPHLHLENSLKHTIVLISLGCCNKISQMGGLQTTEILFLQFWRLKVWDESATIVKLR